MNKNRIQQLQGFMRLSGGFRASRIILTANNLAVFEHLMTPKTATALARKVKTDPRATEILLDAVAALGLLRKTGSKYQNTALSSRFLVKASPLYQGDMLRHSDTLWKNWSGLDLVVRTGQPNRSGERHHESFIRAMHNNAVFRAKNVISAIDMRGVNKALDLGGGPGTYSMEMARQGAAVTLFDLPNTLFISRKIIRDAGVRSIDYIGGDFHTDDIGTGYDLVLISHILHSLSTDECIALLKKSAKALNPRGRIAIQEFFIDDNRASPVPGALFSVNMLVNTTAGRCYSGTEMKGWLRKIGLKNIKSNVLADTVVVTGKKP